MRSILIPAIVLALTLSACTTVKVTRVTAANNLQAKGLRYALGKPFIKVTPNASGDGVYAAELVYLPDDNQIYAVDVTSFMSKYTMELNVDESGILKKVDISKGSSSPATESITALADIAKAELERNRKEEEEKEKELKAEIKANKEAVAKAQDALNQKTIELTNAQNELASLEAAHPDGGRSDVVKEKIRALKVLIQKLTLEQADLQDKLNNLQTTQENLSTAANETGGSKAHGPVLFEIVETRAAAGLSVALKAVQWPAGEKQKSFPMTWTDPNLPKVTANEITAAFDGSGNATVTITLNKVFKSVDFNTSVVDKAGKEFPLNDLSPTIRGRNLILKFKSSDKITKGEYTVLPNIIYTDSDGQDAETRPSIKVTIN